MKLYSCWVKWCSDPTIDKGMEEFGYIFRKSLFRVVRKDSTKKALPTMDIDDALDALYCSSMDDDIIDKMSLKTGLNALLAELSSQTSKKLLYELIEPSPRTRFEAWADLKRKEMVKSQGKKVNIPKDNTIRMKHIIKSLEITTKQYDIAISDIRKTAKAVLKLNYVD